jgi:hypothetical protein
MLRRSKRSNIEVVASKEEEEQCLRHAFTLQYNKTVPNDRSVRLSLYCVGVVTASFDNK